MRPLNVALNLRSQLAFGTPMTFDLVRLGLPNTAALVALAIMPVVALTTLTGIGTTWRLWYDRTYGANIGVNKRLSYDFIDAAGVKHPIPSDVSYNVLLVYRMAMNFAWEFGFSNQQSLRLDQNWRNGWAWNLQWHFLY